MSNKEIANAFDLLAKIMELHNENPFKIRSYQNAYLTLRKLDTPLADFGMEQLMEIKGIGEAIAEKIQSLVKTGSMPTLEKYLAKTPPGVVEMLKINGLGPKKVATLWHEHGFASPGELLYACNENRLIELKGFGEKTQSAIIKAIGFLQSSEGKYLHHLVTYHANEIINMLGLAVPGSVTILTGSLRRGVPIVETMELLTTCSRVQLEKFMKNQPFEWDLPSKNNDKGMWQEFLPIHFYFTTGHDLIHDLVSTTGPRSFAQHVLDSPDKSFNTETELFKSKHLPYISPELRDIQHIEKWSQKELDLLINHQHIKGIIHCHSTYSDGIHSLEAMATEAQVCGYEYLVITDHSQAAAYANGLKLEQLQAQWLEIDHLNQKLHPFKILKGIECDILAHGDLDYNEEILSRFELIIGSIHSVFNMDETKATNRLIRAIENPFTNIIGHPSGRLLLSREGYPLDYARILDACKANQVAIELNANPQRLDIDASHITKCVESGVYVAINPDAHNKTSIKDINYGLISARRGALHASLCHNTMSANELISFCKKR